MRVRIVAPDSRIPNIALMAWSAWHKARGDSVSWTEPRPDRVIISLIFSKNRWMVPQIGAMWPGAEVIAGGPGYDPAVRLPPDVEAMPPDYSIYPHYRGSIGRVTIGCCRHCPWCIVEQDGPRYVHHISTFYRGHPVRVLDDNLLMHKTAWDETAAWFIEHKAVADFDAMDIRCVTPKVASQLAEIKHAAHLHFSFDEEIIGLALRRGHANLVEAGIPASRMMFYVYCSSLDDPEAVASAKRRWQIIRDLGSDPLLMVEPSTVRSQKQRRLIRRAYRPAAYRNLTTEQVFEGSA